MVLQGMAWQQVVALLGTIRAPLGCFFYLLWPRYQHICGSQSSPFWSDALLQIRLLQSSSGEWKKKIIFDSICGGAVPYMIRSFKTFLLPSMSISHIYREGNQSADTLATLPSGTFWISFFLMALFLLPLLPKEVSPPRVCLPVPNLGSLILPPLRLAVLP